MCLQENALYSAFIKRHIVSRFPFSVNGGRYEKDIQTFEGDRKVTQPLSFQVKLQDNYEKAVGKATAALNNEGFGVLTQIDVKATLKEKLNTEFRPYIILGACNPPLAQRALQSDPLVGTLLPCNVTVEEFNGGSLVSIVNPEAMLTLEPLSNNPEILSVAAEARARLERVAASLQAND